MRVTQHVPTDRAQAEAQTRWSKNTMGHVLWANRRVCLLSANAFLCLESAPRISCMSIARCYGGRKRFGLTQEVGYSLRATVTSCAASIISGEVALVAARGRFPLGNRVFT